MRHCQRCQSEALDTWMEEKHIGIVIRMRSSKQDLLRNLMSYPSDWLDVINLPSRCPSLSIWTITGAKPDLPTPSISRRCKSWYYYTWPIHSGHPSNKPLSFRLENNSGSKNLATLTSSLKPFLLLVLSTKSRAVAWAFACSSGLRMTSLSNGSPGTILHLSNTKLTVAWPCVWILKSVSNPKLSMTGNKPDTRYSGVPAIGPSDKTWPLRRAKTVYNDVTESAGPVIEHEYTGSIRRGEAMRKEE